MLNESPNANIMNSSSKMWIFLTCILLVTATILCYKSKWKNRLYFNLEILCHLYLRCLDKHEPMWSYSLMFQNISCINKANRGALAPLLFDVSYVWHISKEQICLIRELTWKNERHNPYIHRPTVQHSWVPAHFVFTCDLHLVIFEFSTQSDQSIGHLKGNRYNVGHCLEEKGQK